MKKDESFDRIEKLVVPFGKPAIHLVRTSNNSGFSKIGGTPTVPEEFEWPECEELPLSFVMQLKFSEINGDEYIPDFPTSGLLYVFYDQVRFIDGIDPCERGGWRVLFYPETDILKTSHIPDELHVSYKEKMLSRNIITTYPPACSKIVNDVIHHENLYDVYHRYKCSIFKGNHMHQVGGYVNLTCYDTMDLRCELASNGINTIIDNYSFYCPPEKVSQNRHEWTLLLQIDSDKCLERKMDLPGNFSNGEDCGNLCFWIKKSDLDNLNFKDVWMIRPF